MKPVPVRRSCRLAAQVLLLLFLGCSSAAMTQNAGDVVVLFENDVHCSVEGYPYIAGLRDSLVRRGCHTAVVSAGDYVSGGVFGATSKGGYIIRLMNAAGYCAAALGNHEFDYGIPRLSQLRDSARFAMVCCNFQHIDSLRPFAAPYALCRCGSRTVGFVGVATPSTVSTANPMYFKNQQGRHVYTFFLDEIIFQTQRWIDSARRAGADYVVLLTHLGDRLGNPTSVLLASQLSGVDAILDGHEHNVIQGRRLASIDGRDVLLASTGTKFSHIGMLVFPAAGSPSVQLVPYFNLYGRRCLSPAVADTLAAIKREYEAKDNYVVAYAEEPLVAENPDGVRVARLQETNLGNLIADAFRLTAGADIGWVNGGALRANIPAGEITHGLLNSVLPNGNRLCMIQATGQDIVNALETGVRSLPLAEGSFPQVSGLSYTVSTRVKSHVELDGNGRFLRVSGRYRVSDVRVAGQPIEPDRVYTVAGPNYVLLDGGDGIAFPSAREVSLTFIPNLGDVAVVEYYLRNMLGERVGGIAARIEGRIVVR